MINFQKISEMENIKTALDKHIQQFLEILEQKELKLISPHMDIVFGYNSFCDAVFYSHNDFKPIKRRKKDFVYSIVSYNTDGVTIKYHDVQILIPYNYDEKFIRSFCDDFFEDLNIEIKNGVKLKEKRKKEREEDEKIDRSIRGKHIYQKYEYRWENCSNCFDDLLKYSTGKILVGTGKYETEEGWERDYVREIKESIACPSCKGNAGLFCFRDNSLCFGQEQKRPCSKWFFAEHEYDFMYLITNL